MTERATTGTNAMSDLEEISYLLNTGLDRRTLAACVQCIELGKHFLIDFHRVLICPFQARTQKRWPNSFAMSSQRKQTPNADFYLPNWHFLHTVHCPFRILFNKREFFKSIQICTFCQVVCRINDLRSGRELSWTQGVRNGSEIVEYVTHTNKKKHASDVAESLPCSRTLDGATHQNASLFESIQPECRFS